MDSCGQALVVQHLGLALLQERHQKGVGVADGCIIDNESCFQSHTGLLNISFLDSNPLKGTISLLQRYLKLSFLQFQLHCV